VLLYGALPSQQAQSMLCAAQRDDCRQKHGLSLRSWPTSTSRPTMTASSQVSWWSVHEHVQPLLDSVDDWPMIGTVAWCALDEDDPRKLAAIYDAAQHWALRVEAMQQARCQASHAISGSLDWRGYAEARRRRSSVYIAREPRERR
jgi:hypothetical protein